MPFSIGVDHIFTPRKSGLRYFANPGVFRGFWGTSHQEGSRHLRILSEKRGGRIMPVLPGRRNR